MFEGFELGSDKLSALVTCVLIAVLLIGGLWAVRQDKKKNDDGGE
jgi:uncharacterized membrane protein YqjE